MLAAGAASRVEAAATTDDPFTSAQRGYWAFQPVERPTPPIPAGRHWSRNPIDAFVLGKLEAKGLNPAPPADKIALIRRASFDLVGLPPTPDEVRAFVEDTSPGAFEKVVERLLASPHYGERWGRHWLDLARFAESSGFETDVTRPNAWRYRDYVINAFNADKPYDRFLQEQIAGDELWPESFEARIATAFNRHYAEEGNQKDLLLARQETLHDITNVVGSTFLGLTFGCAQCHDHKFDPILQKDYYRLQAFFANVNHADRFPIVSADELSEYESQLAAWEDKTAPIWSEMSDLLMKYRNYTPAQLLARYPDYVVEAMRKPKSERTQMETWMASLLATKDCNTCPLKPKPYLDPYFRSVVDKLEGEDEQRFKELDAELEKLAHLKPDDIDRGMGIIDINANPPPTHVLGTGLYTNPFEEVQPGFPAILDPAPVQVRPPPQGSSTGRRAALSRWLADAANPLTPRVMVNRLWHYHFGRGIVATPSDVGMMGERPTHPQLLDWLATEFVDSGWSLKHMHRLIMNSSTYRQSARAAATRRPGAGGSHEDARDADPFNRLLGRFPSSRIEGEVVRDSALAVAGLLNEAVGGRSVYPALPDGMPKPQGGWDTSEEPSSQHRRSVYVFVKRNRPYPLLDAFDFPDTHESCALRNRTTTAPQALTLLNSDEAEGWARAFAGRVLRLAGGDAARQVESAYRLAYSRGPDAWEKDTAITFFARQREIIDRQPEPGEEPALLEASTLGVDSRHSSALVDYCLMLLNSNEFVYRF